MNDIYTRHLVNNFRNFSKIPLNFFNFMLLHNESIWKLLKYDEIDIVDHDDDDEVYIGEMDISQPNLTRDEKIALLYRGGNDTDKYRVFLQRVTDDSEKMSNIKFNIYTDTAIPNSKDPTYILHTVTFEIVCHNKYNVIDNGQRNRVDCIVEELYNLFLGARLENMGEIFFDYNQSRNQDKVLENLSNVKNYFGKTCTVSFFNTSLENKAERNL